MQQGGVGCTPRWPPRTVLSTLEVVAKAVVLIAELVILINTSRRL